MTDEEKQAAAKAAAEKATQEAEAKAAAEAKALEEAERPAKELAAKEEELKKMGEERDNYKKIALKRLGKLDGDADFVAGASDGNGLTVEEQVRLALLDREISIADVAKNAKINQMAKENAELRLALKNRPGTTLGGGSGPSSEVKDNTFSEAQLVELRKRALVLKADPEKFIEKAKQNLAARG